MTTTDIKPVRRGRLAGTGDWRQQYAALRISAEEAAAQIHSGDAVAMPGAASWPYAVDAALTRRLRESGGKIELDGLFTPTDTVLLQPENPDYEPLLIPVKEFEQGTARIIGVAVQLTRKL